MSPADSLTTLTALFGVVMTIMAFVVGIVTWLIFQDGPDSHGSSSRSGEMVAEQGANATGVAVIVVLLLAGAVAAGQIIHWAWS